MQEADNSLYEEIEFVFPETYFTYKLSEGKVIEYNIQILILAQVRHLGRKRITIDIEAYKKQEKEVKF